MNFELFKEIKIRSVFIEILSVLIVGIIILIVLSKVCKISITDSYAEVFSFVITISWFLLVLKFMRKNKIRINNFIGKPSKKRFVFELPVALIVTYLGSIGLILSILFLVHCINPNVLDSLQSSLATKPPKLATPFSIRISFAATVFIAPITEEFIFRGILMNRLYHKYGVIQSIIYSSFIFFIMHINPNPMLLCLGISCGMLVYKYKSLIPSILLHLSNNTITFIRDFNSMGKQASSDHLSINSSVFVLGGILFIIYIIYIGLNLRKCSV